MKCKDCNVAMCLYRTSDAEQDCYYQMKHFIVESGHSEVKTMLSQKELWISETAVRLLAEIPDEYVVSGPGGQTTEPRHLYAARIAKEMADVIFEES